MLGFFLAASLFYPVFVAVVSVAGSFTAIYYFQPQFNVESSKKFAVTRKVPHVVGGALLIGFIELGYTRLAIGLTAASSIGYLAVICGNQFFGVYGTASRLAERFGVIRRVENRLFYLESSFFAFAALPVIFVMANPQAAVAGVAALTLGDAAAAIVGVNGKVRNPFHGSKTLEGSASMFLVTFLLILLLTQEPGRSAVAALAATVSEAAPLGLEDNAAIPLIAAVVFDLL
ncbi:MAG: hypothetical protein M1357_01310 [Candidatus Marsarchaeota archaeon]|nr:hypothetical protein [Candidatus Marsarchaeota archaeon]